MKETKEEKEFFKTFLVILFSISTIVLMFINGSMSEYYLEREEYLESKIAQLYKLNNITEMILNDCMIEQGYTPIGSLEEEISLKEILEGVKE